MEEVVRAFNFVIEKGWVGSMTLMSCKDPASSRPVSPGPPTRNRELFLLSLFRLFLILGRMIDEMLISILFFDTGLLLGDFGMVCAGNRGGVS